MVDIPSLRRAHPTNQVCGVFKCGYTYPAESKYDACPMCGVSEYEIEVVGTNDHQIIRNFDWRMYFKSLRPSIH